MRNIFIAIVCLLSLMSRATGALVTSHTDAGGASPSIDGVISANEYGPGNSYAYTGGGTGFGGQFGNATMYLKSDASYLYVAFSNLGIPFDGNQCMVYFQCLEGGHQPNGTDMDDAADSARRNASILSLYGLETVTFNEGAVRNPDYALVFNNRSDLGFAALYDLQPAGQSHNLVAHDRSGLGVSTVEFRVSLASLGLTNGVVVDFAGINNSETGYLSNEGFPPPNLSSNIGFATNQTTVLSNFHRFVTAPAGPPPAPGDRRPNTTLNFPQAAPSAGTNSYVTENAFPGVSFINPMTVAVAPGETNRLYVLERAGRIAVITNFAAPTRTVFLDHAAHVNGSGEGGFLGFAFHPNYQSNRQFFIYYTRTATNGTGTGFHTRLSRFERTGTNLNLALSSSEVVLFSQFNDAQNHNGADVHFGTDGYLYVGVGDEGNANDSLNNAQIIDKDFFAGLLRLDVDKKPGSLAPKHHLALGGVTNYAIPPDNPFILTTNYYGSNVVPARVRTEFFATGLRNPFRFHIDRVAGLIYVADVGQNVWEEINLVTNGGNYGWAAWEAFATGPKPNARPASDYARPILAYQHGSTTNRGNSITGGIVYRGNRFPELVGHYLFADYESANIWALTHNGVTNTSFKWLAADQRIVGFGEDPTNGDILLCDIVDNQVKRLVYSAAPTGSFPNLLSQAGIFSNLNTLAVYDGIVPYTINVPFWSDAAIKRRWFSVPDTNLVIGFNAEGAWSAPTTTVWIKHFDFLLTSGVPASARRLETRVLVKSNTGSGGYGVTYRWGTSTNDAVLVPTAGLDEALLINESGVIRTQVWRYPSRAECLSCHTPGAGFALSFNTPQMHIDSDLGWGVTGQIAALRDADYFAAPPTNLHLLRRLAHATNTGYSVEYRVRSYLQANCAQCHYPGGPSTGGFDTRVFTPLSNAGLIDGPLNDNGGNPSNRVIVRSFPTNSMLLHRISFRGGGQMPPVGSNLVDTQNVALVTAWITGEAAAYESFEEWQVRHFGSSALPDAQPDSDPDEDGGDNRHEYLTGTQPTNALEVWGIDIVELIDGGPPAVAFDQVARRGFEVQVSTSLVDAAWQTLDIPENEPVFRAVTQPALVPDMQNTNEVEQRFLRVKVYEP